MSCLYPLPYFSLLFTYFLAPIIRSMFVCTKCWCLSYVFSAFGLFSYCLPGLFGSSPSQPVWCFLALLGCWSGHVFVCQPSFPTTVNLSICLSVSCVSISFSLWCVLLHFFPIHFPTAIQSQSSEVSSFQVLLCILCSLFVCHWIFTWNCLYVSWTSVWFEMCCLFCILFFFVLSIHLFMGFPVFSASLRSEFFSVSFELHFRSVLSCMCMVVSRPQWRTSWRRRCQRKEDAGGSHGGAGTVTPNQ